MSTTTLKYEKTPIVVKKHMRDITPPKTKKQSTFWTMPSEGWFARLQAFGALLVLDGIAFIGAHVYLYANLFGWIGFVLGMLFLNEKVSKRIK